MSTQSSSQPFAAGEEPASAGHDPLEVIAAWQLGLAKAREASEAVLAVLAPLVERAGWRSGEAWLPDEDDGLRRGPVCGSEPSTSPPAPSERLAQRCYTSAAAV